MMFYFAILFTVVKLTTSATVVSDTFAVSCKIGETKPPIGANGYNDRSSLLQIFSWMRAPCDGIVRSIDFINHAPGLNKSFYFAIFEPMSPYPGSFRLVNYVKVPVSSNIVGWKTARFEPNAGFKPPLRVANGTNVFGYLYDNWNKQMDDTVVPHWTNFASAGKTFQTYVGVLSLSNVIQVRELRSGLELQKQPVSRIPALSVNIVPEINKHLSCNYPPEAPHAHIITEIIKEEFMPGESVAYDCDDDYVMLENMFVICQPDAIWSALPICVPLVSETRTSTTTTTTTTTTPGTTAATEEPAYCDDPPELSNAYILSGPDYDSYPKAGEVVQYECEKGYTFARNGLDSTTCLQNGSWSYPIPECVIAVVVSTTPAVITTAAATTAIPRTTVAVPTTAPPPERFCEDPPVIANAKIVSGSADYNEGVVAYVGHIVTYECDTGYSFSDPTQNAINCLDNETWSTLPKCVRKQQCQANPPQVTNARILTGLVASGDNAAVGHVITYQCNPGYQLANQSVNTIACLDDEKWSTSLPECVQKTCEDPPEITNGYITSGLSDDAYSFPPIGHVVTYKCNPGYGFADRASSITCLDDETWSTPLPQCVRRRCDAPAAIANSLYVDVDYENDYYRVTCAPGYITSTATDMATCNTVTMRWSPKIECSKTCGPPPRIPYSRIDYQSFSGSKSVIGSIVRYFCIRGYTRYWNHLGDDVVCTTKGWSPPDLPQCIPRS